MSRSLIIYPKLSGVDLGFIRIGGAGLANCMFVAARAYLETYRSRGVMLRPTWERIGLGQWLRGERDKRFYGGLFAKSRFKDALRKMRAQFRLLLAKSGWGKETAERTVVVSGIEGYFEPLLHEAPLVRKYFKENINPHIVSLVPKNLSYDVAVHIRLGDYPAHLRTDLSWYSSVIRAVAQRLQGPTTFHLFSDGSDDELSDILALPGVKRAFYGNALADIVAISRCRLLIGSDSTFSGWGAFLGGIPAVFAHLHYSEGCSVPENWLVLECPSQALDDKLLKLFVGG